MMRHRVPPEHRSRVPLGAELFTSREALRLGLVDEVADDAEAVARRRLAALAAHPPEAYAITKAALCAGAAPGPEDERRFVEEEVPIWSSSAMRARVLAVLEH
jgi:enoyl-CoA hydratase/carnithine racemase